MTFTRTVTVAAGVFAPGHPGELTWQVPFELADAVLEETRARERRLHALPSPVGIYFVLALGLFPALGYQNVRAKLTAALAPISTQQLAQGWGQVRERDNSRAICNSPRSSWQEVAVIRLADGIVAGGVPTRKMGHSNRSPDSRG